MYQTAAARGGDSAFTRRRDPMNPQGYLVFEPSGNVSALLTSALTRMGDAGLSRATVNGYSRGALRFFTYRSRMLGTASTRDLLPWISAHDIRMLFRDFLVSLKGKVEPSTTEADVWHVTARDEDAVAIVQNVCGTFHAFEALVHAGVLRLNPFEVPIDKRMRRRLPGAHGMANAPFITPRFRFRIPSTVASALRTDSERHFHLIVPALIAFGVPPSIVMMIKTMAEGLARISEQCRLSIWDYWEASGFGDAIDTTNKGDGDRRVKVQVFSAEHVGEILLFFDGDRRKLDRDGWGLNEWRAFLTDESIPLRIRKAKAIASPLFPNAAKGFYDRSGVVDVWYRPAMRAAGLPTRTHYLRHCGVNNFLAYIAARDDLTAAEKDAARLEFAKSMGWKWPEVMLARYSLPQRRHAAFEVRRGWLDHRAKHDEAITEGLGRPPSEVIPMTGADKPMSRLMKFACDAERLAA